MEEQKKFIEEFNHFCKCINFNMSALDGEAIQFMNEFNQKLNSVIEEAKNDSTRI